MGGDAAGAAEKRWAGRRTRGGKAPAGNLPWRGGHSTEEPPLQAGDARARAASQCAAYHSSTGMSSGAFCCLSVVRVYIEQSGLPQHGLWDGGTAVLSNNRHGRYSADLPARTAANATPARAAGRLPTSPAPPTYDISWVSAAFASSLLPAVCKGGDVMSWTKNALFGRDAATATAQHEGVGSP